MKNKITKEFKYIKTSFFYGWVIVIIGAMGIFFSGPGQTYSISIFINYYVDNLGWSRTLVSSYYSLATLIAGFALPTVGRAIDIKGHRKIITLISIMLGLVCLWMSFVTRPSMLIVGFVFLRLFGQGSMTLIPSTLIPLWFVNSRGKALSFMALGGVAGSALLPPINNWLISNMGVGFTWRVWMVLLIFVMAPFGWVFVRNRPEDIGCLPDGIVESNYPIEGFKHIIKIDFSEYSWTVKDALKTRSFWLMLFCITIPSMINTGITFHMVSIIDKKGFTSIFAAFILSLTAIVQLPLTFIAGHLLDKAKVHYVKSINFCVLLIAIILLLYGDSKKSLLIYGVLQGTFVAFDSVSTGVLWPNYYGIKNLGSIRSITMTAMVIASALGPLPFGYAYDYFGGYKEILLIMMIFPILGSLAAFFSPAPKEPNNLDIK